MHVFALQAGLWRTLQVNAWPWAPILLLIAWLPTAQARPVGIRIRCLCQSDLRELAGRKKGQQPSSTPGWHASQSGRSYQSQATL
jgi:hypothetical protein